MINKIWFFIIAFSIAFAATNGRLELLNQEIFASLKSSLDLSLGLLGSMMLWCGLLKAAEKAGLVEKLSSIIRPAVGSLFQDIPAGSAAMGAMIMNITSNMLGLGNAATPFGLKAMTELQKLNKEKDTATNAMCQFLVINGAPICLIPSTVISIRASLGSGNPGAIIIPSIISSAAAITVGVICCKVMERIGGNAR
ncbi:nucleoside recognition domain-containing protein [Lutispora saccharofermentans]|uniref:Spore maturation protein n=1 Tax=Lutispora saccharofermentans TaxID=3024236 RepID=A0ABT1NF39_9FIRM|nr:nucleoside recognition domain-containing protein [Lutispora saccharofermentans]MCQ1528966.1 spore maturation protein [Lutispora saccharofermentans]